jgi:hypothetical protein
LRLRAKPGGPAPKVNAVIANATTLLDRPDICSKPVTSTRAWIRIAALQYPVHGFDSPGYRFGCVIAHPALPGSTEFMLTAVIVSGVQR